MPPTWLLGHLLSVSCSNRTSLSDRDLPELQDGAPRSREHVGLVVATAPRHHRCVDFSALRLQSIPSPYDDERAAPWPVNLGADNYGQPGNAVERRADEVGPYHRIASKDLPSSESDFTSRPGDLPVSINFRIRPNQSELPVFIISTATTRANRGLSIQYSSSLNLWCVLPCISRYSRIVEVIDDVDRALGDGHQQRPPRRVVRLRPRA